MMYANPMQREYHLRKVDALDAEMSTQWDDFEQNFAGF